MGSLFSFNRLKGMLELGSVNTVKNYTQFFEDTFLLFSVRGYDCAVKRQFLTPRKVYCIDNGVNNAVSFRFSRDRGRHFENLAALEMKRRGWEPYYYRTKNGNEVDFSLRREEGTTALLQACSDISRRETREREVRAQKTAVEDATHH